jgi:hypothetical protein
LFLLTSCALVLAQTAAQPANDHPCERDPAYHKLDFWLGHWDVFDNQDGTKGGTNFIEKILDGAALCSRTGTNSIRGGRWQESLLLSVRHAAVEAGPGHRHGPI